MPNTAVETINDIGARHRGAVKKATSPNTGTFKDFSLEVRFADTSAISTNRLGITALKKAIDAGEGGCTVDTSAQGAAQLVNTRQVISLENNNPTTPATGGASLGTLENCDRGVWLSSGDMISTDSASVIAISSALKNGDAMVDVQLASGFVRTLVVAHIAHAVSNP
jgi:hypothetical protein